MHDIIIEYAVKRDHVEIGYHKVKDVAEKSKD